MVEYNFKKIEKKWQNIWEKDKIFNTKESEKKEKYYMLVEFPYPSGAGLHVGHVRSYTALDAVARKKRMEGYNVLFPMGWDAFGNPAEQYAIKHHMYPREAVKENIKTFKNQIQNLGISFDWSREFSTTDPEYYKWTQWQFLQFFKHNMAYKAKKNVNWCPNCKTVLSNEDSSGGTCVRCGTKVVQKEKEQWMLRMSEYAEDLLTGLEKTNFADRVKLGQINWIGKSIGAEIKFKIKDSDEVLTVFTTRPDTLYGATFLVVAPEHNIINKLNTKINNIDEINKYKENAKNKTEFERVELAKEKTGVKLEGIKAVNPINNKEIDVWTSDYVMVTYGTGAIMAVPAHDQRDYDFAKKFNIPIIEVIKGGNIKESAYTGDGEMINSGILNGIKNKSDAINKTIDYITKNNIGNKKVNYRLQDWIFSRQRFWGEPIPLIHCEKCGWVAVPDEELPVELPDVESYEPTSDGESPLANITSWVNVACPKCGEKAKRETDTMPNWAGSSWYYLRYMDPHNNKEFASREALNYWGKVDFYNGGMEHTARHLLYARFWNQFLYNIGLVPNKEPFNIRVSHGMILGPNGEKMSKSKGNVINPDDIVDEFGCDTLRTYEMFIGDYEKDAAWNTNGLKGCKRFLDRVWRLQEKINNKDQYSKNLENVIHKTIKKVSEDIETLKFNTAVSALMILLNKYEKEKEITRGDYRVLILLLNPFAPHITEEINELRDLGKRICDSEWPCYDESKMIEQTYNIGIQINGKIRDEMTLKKDESEERIKELVLSREKVQKNLENKKIIKMIIIPEKIISIVAK